MNNQDKLDAVEGSPQLRGNVYYDQTASDEINLGDLIRNLIGEWKTIVLVVVIGFISAIAVALYLPKTYVIESLIRVPSVQELGDLKEQNILEINPDTALRRVVDELLSSDVMLESLESSKWMKWYSENSSLTASQISRGIREKLSVAVVRHGYYELAKNEKAPFKEIEITLRSSQPELATEFVVRLIANAHDIARTKFFTDVNDSKNTQVAKIQEQLQSLSLAAKQSREAEIMRLQEANQLAISELQQQIDLKISQTIKDRENQIVRLEEALKTATELGIKEPVTWDDLRPLRKSTQITNELGDKDSTAPLYFRGSRLLNAELVKLKERKDDKPFITGLTGLETKIIELQNDPKIAALRSRANDTIYIEEYDVLQQQLADLLEQPTRFENAQMAIVAQPALAPSTPTRSSALIVVIGVFLSGFLALIVALIRVSMRNSERRQNEIPLVDQ